MLIAILIQPVGAQIMSDTMSGGIFFDSDLVSDSGFIPYNPSLHLSPQQVDSLLKINEYDSTRYLRNSDHWRNELLKLIAASSGKAQEQNLIDSIRYVSAGRYARYSGKIVKNIEIRQLEIFGQDILDPTQIPEKWVDKLGNGLHVNTQRKIIQNLLLFNTGDTIDPLSISDNERLIRDLPYIEDAVILIDEIGTDSVSVVVVTKDVLPVGFSYEVYDVEYGKIGAWNKNLLGLGHEFYYYLTYDYNRNPNYGHRMIYRIENIGQSFVTGIASYENLWNLEAYSINLNRDFFTPTIKFAGGLGLERVNSHRDIILPDSVLSNVSVSYTLQDFWMGRSLLLKNQVYNNKRTNIAVTMRLTRYQFLNRPGVEEDYLYEFHNRTSLLSSIGISKQSFLKSTLIYGYGKAEDVPYGWLLTLTGGYEITEFLNRPYLGLSYSWGKGSQGFGYLYQKIEYGTFLNKNIEQDKFNYSFKYISPLMNSTERYNYRIFTNLSYTGGFARFDDEYLELSNDNGIRGLNSTVLRGNQQLSLNIEGVCYSPHQPLGFRFVYFLFVDAGIISYQKNQLFANPIYTGFGAGLRIKNERLVFSALQIRLAYYPVIPEMSTTENFQIRGVSDPVFNNFIIPKPEILKYQNP